MFHMFTRSPVSYKNNITVDTQVLTLMGYNPNPTEFIPVDGSVFFIINQVNESPINLTRSVNLSSIPTLKLPTGDVLAVLLCVPHISIQTRQIRATGNGNLTLGKLQRSQGNIDFYQANYLLSYTLESLTIDSGPTSSAGQVGTDVMAQFIFGNSSIGHPVFPDNLPPAPLTNITAVYKQIVQSAMKTVLSGQIATQNVPGGYTEEQTVFTSSLDHVYASAVFFAFLTIVLVAAQFRKGRATFTLVNVAAALADSEMPLKAVEMTQFKDGTGKRKVLKLVPSDDGRLKCAYQSIV